MPKISKKYKNITVVADKRERSITSEFSDLIIGESDSNGTEVHLHNKVITIGDFIIGVEMEHCPASQTGKDCLSEPVASTDDDEIQFAEVHAIIERKSYDDYAASIKDGRIENTEKLLAARERLENCTVFYIVEGSGTAAKYGGIPIKNIRSSIFNLQMQYGISIIYTKSTKDTAQTIGLLARSIVNMINRGKRHATISLGGPSPGARIPNGDSDTNSDASIGTGTTESMSPSSQMSITGGRVTKSREKTWCALFKGVGPKLAKALSAKFTISELCRGISEEEIVSQMKGSRISKNMVSAISGLPTTMDGGNLVISILSSIAGIGAKVANEIVEKMGGFKIAAAFMCRADQTAARKFAKNKFDTPISEVRLAKIIDWVYEYGGS